MNKALLVFLLGELKVCSWEKKDSSFFSSIVSDLFGPFSPLCLSSFIKQPHPESGSFNKIMVIFLIKNVRYLSS